MDESPCGSLFHKWDFLRIVEKHSGYRLLPYGIYRDGELACLLPLYSRYRGPIRLLLSPPPQTCVPYLGFLMGSDYDRLPLSRQEGMLNEIAREIATEVKRLPASHVAIQTTPGFIDIRPFWWNGFRMRINYEYFIDLDRPLDRIWDALDTDCKKSIKAHDREPLRLERSYNASEFYRIMESRLDRTGQTFNALTPEYLREILETYPGNVQMYFLYHGNDLQGAKVTYGYKGKFILWMGSAFGHYNEYLTWEMIKRAKSENYRLLENPDADTKRLTSFKAKFNPGLEVGYTLRMQGVAGRVAEWSYTKLLAGLWHRRGLSHA